MTLAPYRGELREAVILMKKPRYEPLRRALGLLLAEQVLEAVAPRELPQPPLLIAVPNHWSRGFAGTAHTAESLSQAIAYHTGWPQAHGAVRRIRKTSKQGMLTWAERSKNVRGAFHVRRPQLVAGRHVVLVDDVLTSGATAAEIAKLLTQAGAHDVSAAVVARGTGARE